MIKRCHNPEHPRFGDYGGRGIKVCEQWRMSCANFVNDMGLKPTPNHQIERIDNNKGYCKENCKWATRLEQAQNTRASRIISFGGESLTLAEWARKTGLHHGTIQLRLKRGWSVEKSLTSKDARFTKQLD